MQTVTSKIESRLFWYYLLWFIHTDFLSELLFRNVKFEIEKAALWTHLCGHNTQYQTWNIFILSVFENGKVNKIVRLKKFGIILSCVLRHYNVGFITCNMQVTSEIHRIIWWGTLWEVYK